MTVTEAVKLSGLTPSADYTGVETTDDFLLAVQTEASQTDFNVQLAGAQSALTM